MVLTHTCVKFEEFSRTGGRRFVKYPGALVNVSRLFKGLCKQPTWDSWEREGRNGRGVYKTERGPSLFSQVFTTQFSGWGNKTSRVSDLREGELRWVSGCSPSCQRARCIGEGVGGDQREGWGRDEGGLGGRAVLIKQVYSDQRQSLASLHISASWSLSG